jgi:CheY-like chemotaxis protein
LAISKRLVELMGGKIWVESEINRGSIFHFTVNAPEFSGDAAKLHLSGKKIMALFDSEEALKTLVDYARVREMQIFPVVSASEARDLRDDQFNAAMLDLDVPGAIELAEELEEHIPVITLSSSNRSRSGRRALSKPLTPEGICFAMQEAFIPQNHRIIDANLDEVELRDLKILLAEDNQVNQKVALLMLKKLGYSADVVSNGRDALQAAMDKPYDVILMDVQMPEMDGLEATRRILDSKLANRPKILALTAHALEGDRERCLLAGMDGYISKPVRLDELIRALHSVMNKHPGQQK